MVVIDGIVWAGSGLVIIPGIATEEVTAIRDARWSVALVVTLSASDAVASDRVVSAPIPSELAM